MVYDITVVAIARAVLLVGVWWAVALALTAATAATIVFNTGSCVVVDHIPFVAIAVTVIFER